MWWKKCSFMKSISLLLQIVMATGLAISMVLEKSCLYLKECGIDALWLTPFYPSPRVDNGYDVSIIVRLIRNMGLWKTFDHFWEEAHALSIKVIIDVVLNHTSTAHPWFMESSASQASAKRDWYIWRDQSNNWESFLVAVLGRWIAEPISIIITVLQKNRRI